MNVTSLSALFSRMTPSGRAGTFILGAVIFLALAAPLVCSHSHQQMSGPALIPPGPEHIMGTDELGVDLWAQICHGARISLIIGLGTALAAGLGGGIAGIVSGYAGGLTDMIIMRMVDALLVLPELPVMIVLAAFFGPSLLSIVLVLSCFSWVHTARIVRSRVLALKQRQYIRAAELNGASAFYLIRRHFLPEVFPLAAVSMIRLTGRAIVAEAGLSFLGLGDPASGSWGLILTLQQHLGFAMILVSHAMPAIARMTENIVTLYAGQVIETGPTQAVLADPCHPYTRGLINACPEFYGYKDLWGIAGTPPSPGSVSGCPFCPRCVQHGPDCKTRRPPLVKAGKNRLVACHKGGITTVLEARGLEKIFDLNGTAVRAVHQVDITIKFGEVVALVGPSGSGKSTLAHLLVALEIPDKGRVSFQGAPLTDNHATSCMHGMQLVFQDPAQAVSPRLTVMEAVREPLDIMKWKTQQDRDKKALAALPLVHLSQDTVFLNQPCHALSGGQRQRVSVARALVTDPVLLIADEITAMLDPSAQAHLLPMLKGLQHKKGFSMLFISHDIHLARKIADRAYVLDQGKIIAKGAGYEVFESTNPSEITFKTGDHLYDSGQSLEYENTTLKNNIVKQL